MDEASGLIAELEQKLRELDHRVWLYRRDMISEFDKYVESLLEDVPEEISSTVTGAIAESIKAFPLLDSSRHGAEAQASLPPAEAEATLSTALSAKAASASPGILEMTAPPSVVALDQPGSPYARENEFPGVFTQSYLPLLDHSDRRMSAQFDTATPSIAIQNKKAKATEDPSVGSLSSSYSGPSSSLSRKPPPRRRNTADESLASDKAEGPIRRSAMRRTSSSAKAQSPRHVRFEFAGEEFATTSTPAPAVTFVTETDSQPIGLGLGGFDEESGLLEVEDVAESPPPKKVSSSQALRALSRGPFEDDGTKWDEVVAPPDGSASVSISDASYEESEDEEFLTMSKSTGPKMVSNGIHASEEEQDSFSEGPEEVNEAPSVEMIPSPSSQPRQSSTQIPVTSSPSPLDYKENTPSSASKPQSRKTAKAKAVVEQPEDSESDSDFFEFEAISDSTSNSPKLKSKPFQQVSSESDSDSDSPPASPTSKSTAAFASLATYSSSPARPITRPISSPTANQPTSPTLRNSYHPFQTPVVNEAIHAKAAGMGVVNSFVGSVSGASGMDESDVRSFRGSFGGTGSSVGVGKGRGPGGARSLSERMLMEEQEPEGGWGS